MKTLPKTVKITGCGIEDLTATLITRTRTKAMYERSDGYIEVFRIKIAPKQEAFGNTYPEREMYPSTEQFGQNAWCYKSHENALKMYDNLP